MLKRFLVITFLFIMLLPISAQAQDEIRLSYLQVDLWPEYDRAEMLVIYRVQLAGDVSLPTEVTFRIPAAAGTPNAVAVRQPDGALLNAMFDQQVEDLWTYVTVTATAPEIQLEYYDPQIEKQGADRSFEFAWLGEYDVEAMVIQVQQPVGASGMSIEPDLGEFIAGTDGLQYYTMEVGAPLAGDSVSVKVNYQKDDDSLSVDAFQVQPSVPIAEGGQDLTQINPASLVPWFLGGLGVLLVVGGILWYWRSGQEPSAPKQTSRGRRATAKSEADFKDTGDAKYCHQCGKRAAAGDRFCRTCGARLRGG